MVASFLFVIFSVYLFINELSILQMQFYEIKRYLYFKKEKKIINKFNALALALILINIITVVYLQQDYLFTILLIYLLFSERKEKIIKFKYTPRVKRLIGVYFLLIFTIFFVLRHKFLILFIFELIYIIFYRYVNILILLIELPIEKLINLKYKRKAINKLKRINPIIIGVTGSYGKTSTKNYLYQLLSLKYRVCKTPKSYNTYLGIIKSINDEMNENCEIMIIELGADKVNSFDKILSFLEFDISIITSIGPQHLKTFKNIDNIVKEKAKILDKTKKHIVLNYNYEYLRSINLNNEQPLTTYSYYLDTDICVKKITFKNNQSQFILTYKNKEYLFETNILGKHQIENLIGSITIALLLNIDIDLIRKKVLYLFNESHRMEIKYLKNLTIIDDSYNSNIYGFRCALDVLKSQDKYRILITPGVIELGKEWEKENRKLGEYTIDKVDLVVLVGRNVTRPFYQGLLNKGFMEEKIIIVDSFSEGMEYINNINEEKVLLIENDLPDFYLK